jgi:hypothetical protein
MQKCVSLVGAAITAERLVVTLPILQTDVEAMWTTKDVAVLLASFSYDWSINNW